MRVRLRRSASANLRAITNYIARENPSAAQALVRRIDSHLALIVETGFTAMGSPGRISGTRHFVEGRYIIIYRFDELRDEIVVLAIKHGARRR